MIPENGATIEVTSLTALPPPAPADIAGPAGDPWRPFLDYALEQDAALASPAERPESALLSAEGVSYLQPKRRPCGGREPAVIVDLDSGPETFSPENAGPAAPGLAEVLARLRDAGILILWISSADGNRVNEVAEVLRRTGLDRTGRDPLLLVLNDNDRKQTMREEANEDLCVIAIAGDQRADFDELFNYLRNPDAAIGLEALIGSGWFITPAPLTPASRQ